MKYFDIAWSSIKDGPSTRVVLFLQECNSRCIWCHSPHSQSKCAPILFYADYCQKCGKCAEACTAGNHIVNKKKHSFKRDGCTRCGSCVLACPNQALEYSFYQDEPSSIFKKLESELALLKDIGGITVSGGEPLLQYSELKELLKLCKDSCIHTAVETSGAVERLCFEEIYDYVDCWLFGLKQTDEKLCKSMTGADFNTISSNLTYLAQKAPERIIVRMPLIPGYTDSTSNITKIADIIKSNNLKMLQLLPYNPCTAYYYMVSGIPFNEKKFDIPTEPKINFILDFFRQSGIDVSLVR